MRRDALGALLTLTCTHWSAGCGQDTGMVANGTVWVTGAQTRAWDYRDGVNRVACEYYPDMADHLRVRLSRSDASMEDGVEFTTGGFVGSGAYGWTFMANDPVHRTADVWVGNQHRYWSFYDYSRIDLHEEYSRCDVNLQDDDAEQRRLTGEINCTQLWAHLGSTDYESSPTEFQVSVDLSATFSCGIETY